MHLRHDPFSAAAEIALEVERLARSDGEAVATVGRVTVAPGAANVIPGRVTMSIDVRHPDDARRAGLLAGVREIVAAVAGRRGVEAHVEVVHDERSVACDRPSPGGCGERRSESASIRPRFQAAPATTRSCSRS